MTSSSTLVQQQQTMDPTPQGQPVEGGRCSCCPYGYHIDLDFVRYCEDSQSGTMLKQLKKIKRDKKRLRKSMEVQLQGQQIETDYEPRQEMVGYDSGTNRYLNDIDSSVDTTLHTIDKVIKQTSYRTYSAGDSDFSPSPTSPTKFTSTMYTTNRALAGSNSSISSQTTVNSEMSAVNGSPGPERYTTVTAQLAAVLAAHLPRPDPSGEAVPIYHQSLIELRQQLAISLQKMRDLEEQVKSVPLLQTRMSVLKEEKRLLELQLLAKQSKPTSTYSIGVGDYRVDVEEPRAPRRPDMRSIGVGNKSVTELYTLQPHLLESQTLEKEMHTQRLIREKETKVVVVGQEQRPTSPYSPMIKTMERKPITRSVGVGDGNVFEKDQMQIQEKELRTIIIDKEAKKQTRNVGISVRVPMRDVGVHYHCEAEKPSQRDVGVSVGTRDTFTSTTTYETFRATTILQSLFQLQHISAPEIRNIISTMLHRDVASKSTMTDVSFKSGVDKEVLTDKVHTVDEASSSDTIDVEVRPIKEYRSVYVDAEPSTANKATGINFISKMDFGTNTVTVQKKNSATSTTPKLSFPAETQTISVPYISMGTETDMKIFLATEQIRNQSTNTDVHSTVTQAVGTRDDDSDFYLRNFGTNTEKVQTRSKGVGDGRAMVRENTEGQVVQQQQQVKEVSKQQSYQPQQQPTPKSSQDRVVTETITTYTSQVPSVVRRVKNTHLDKETLETQRRSLLGLDDAATQQLQDTSLRDLVSSSVTRSYKSKATGGQEKSDHMSGLHIGELTKGKKMPEDQTETFEEWVEITPVYQERVIEARRKGGEMTSSTSERTRDFSSSSSSSSATGMTVSLDSTDLGPKQEIIPHHTIYGGKRIIDSSVGQGYKPSVATYTSMRSANRSPSPTETSYRITESRERSGGGTVTGTVEGGDSGVTHTTETYFISKRGSGDGKTGTSGGGGGGRSSSRVEKVISSSGPLEDSSAGGGFTKRTEYNVTSSGHVGSSGRIGAGGGGGGSGGYTRKTERIISSSTSSGGSGGVSSTVSSSSGGGGSGMAGSGSRSSERTVTSTVHHDLPSNRKSRTEKRVTVSSTGHSGGTSRMGGGDGRTFKTQKIVISPTGEMSEDMGFQSQVSNAEQLMSDFHGRIMGSAMQGMTSGTGGDRNVTTTVEESPDGVTTIRTEKSSYSSSSSSNRMGGDGGLNITGGGMGREQHAMLSGLMDSGISMSEGTGLPAETVSTKSFSYSGTGGLREALNMYKNIQDNERESMSDGSGRVTSFQSSSTTTSSSHESPVKEGVTRIAVTHAPETTGVREVKSVVETDIDADITTGETTTTSSSSSSTSASRQTSTSSTNGANGTIRSIMKKSSYKSSKGSSKKGISFSDDVTGGYASSSGEEESEPESDESFDEGSYDGRHMTITYTCKDDEKIADGAPGTGMFDQNIRETYELSEEMQASCELLSRHLEDPNTIPTEQVTAAATIIQQEWFKAAGQKLSSPYMVEDFLSCFNEYSKELLERIVNMTDTNGNTALHYSVSHCNWDVVSLLLDTGLCEVDKPNRAGYTAIMLASLADVQTEEQKDVVKQLFDAGDVNSRASQAGQTALMLAVSHGRLEMVRLLAEAGADVNAQDEDGSTALMCASEHGHSEIVRLLLSMAECDASLADNDGSTALSIAMEAGHKDIGILLYARQNIKSSPGLARSHKEGSMASRLPLE
ncbi:uncharacterized protein LOC106160634 isoform X2 [Lingula anatina]|uniref:Uncharacterized protein LOC106160634 isoform X2 n=1 Tax=Lingula anatina TaxID=7574 RepID=A0A1S3I394_LINAN|nr:uncharacterized protein LOC106160634 isoform X2 [Lingula anatina]|eukprot:XP_013392740.1 uncharacterized protein LOC106160634 isoform X2 [Lingula anatina]